MSRADARPRTALGEHARMTAELARLREQCATYNELVDRLHALFTKWRADPATRACADELEAVVKGKA